MGSVPIKTLCLSVVFLDAPKVDAAEFRNDRVAAAKDGSTLRAGASAENHPAATVRSVASARPEWDGSHCCCYGSRRK